MQAGCVAATAGARRPAPSAWQAHGQELWRCRGATVDARACRWKHIRKDAGWQAGAFYGLAAAYALLAAVALVQLVRISRRCPQYGWTTQKVFHLLNLLVCILRAVVMALHSQLEVRTVPQPYCRASPGCTGAGSPTRSVQGLHSPVLKLLFNDLPGLLFFTTYTLLVLFWAGIYHQARSQATARLRPTFLAVNVAVYAVQVCLLLLCGFHALHRFAAVRPSRVRAALLTCTAAASEITL